MKFTRGVPLLGGTGSLLQAASAYIASDTLIILSCVARHSLKWWRRQARSICRGMHWYLLLKKTYWYIGNIVISSQRKLCMIALQIERRHLMRLLGASVASAVAVCRADTAQGVALRGGDTVLNYAVVDQELRDVIAGLAAQMGLRANVSAQVRGRVHGRLAPARGIEMLDRLASLYGFDWYCDGETLYVSANHEFDSRMLRLDGVSEAEFVAALDKLGIEDARWPLRTTPDANIAIAEGPPRYLALVQQTLDALLQEQHEVAQATHVFRGSAAP